MYILFLVSIFALIILPQDNTEFYLSAMKVGIMSISDLEWLRNSLILLIYGDVGELCVCVCVCEDARNVMLQHDCLYFISD
jgi:hypothetical protein